MEKFLLKQSVKFLLAAALLFSLGCGKSDDVDATKSVDEFVQTGNISQKNGTSEYEGTGSLRFIKTLSSSQSSTSLVLEAQLLDTTSRIDIVTFASKTDLSDGLHLTLVPNGTGLAGSLELNGSGPRTLSTVRLSAFNPHVSMTIDFHGYGSTGRVLAFRPGVTNAGAFDFDSARAGDLNATVPASPLPGVFYGLILTNVHLITAHAQNTISAR